MPHWIGTAIDLLVDVLGVLGACLVAMPALRDLGYREMLGLLRRGTRMNVLPRASKIAADLTEAEMSRFRPGDRKCLLGGLAAIGASYLLHMVGVILREAIPLQPIVCGRC